MSRLHPTLHPELTSGVLEKLFKRKIFTALSFVQTDPEFVVKVTGLQYGKVLQIKNQILTKFSSPLVTGRDLYGELISQCAILETGIASLDGLIDGGFVTGNIYELCGAAGSGKTQVCMTIAVNICSSLTDQTVLWIDTKNDISGERLLQMMSGRWSESERTARVMERIKIKTILNVHRMLSFLHGLSEDLRVADGRNLGFRLVVIDSLSALFGRYSGEDRSEGSALLNNLASILHVIAVEYHVAVLLTNLVTSWTTEIIDADSGDGGTVQEIQTPLLGKYWLHVPNTRINVKKLDGGDDCLLVILKSTSQPVGKAARVTISENGVR